MSITNKLKRFELIISKVEASKYPTFDDIWKHLKRYDRGVSDRTLQRDFKELNSEFQVSLEYDKKQRGYFIEKNTLTDNVIQFIKNMSLQAGLLEFAKVSQNSGAIILKEQYDLKGLEWIPMLLNAVQHTLVVELMYRPFDTVTKKYTLQPYALKEFLGRWYVAGIIAGKDAVFKFGIDRIVGLTISDKKFKKDKAVDLHEYFSRMIGIIDEGGKRDTVVLSFTPFQANYIRTLPLHWSQKEILINEKEVQFEYFLLPNYELLQKIMSYGAEVKVISPASLQKQHKETLKRSMERYK